VEQSKELQKQRGEGGGKRKSKSKFHVKEANEEEFDILKIDSLKQGSSHPGTLSNKKEEEEGAPANDYPATSMERFMVHTNQFN
jgi:hypothetical protein